MEDDSKKLVIKNGRRRSKSVIAAYVSGKLPLHKIVHPSRLTAKNIQRHLVNHLDLNSYTVPGKPLRANRTKRPLLRDYINGIVPVTAMLTPEKITDISTKREEQKKIAQVQNFPDWENLHRLSSQANKNFRSWWKLTNCSAGTSSVSDEKSLYQRRERNDSAKNSTLKMSANDNCIHSLTPNQYESTQITSTGSVHPSSASRTSVWTLVTNSLEDINNNSSANLAKNETIDNETISSAMNTVNDEHSGDGAESHANVKSELVSTKDESFVSIQDECPPGEGCQNPRVCFGEGKLDANIASHLMPQIYVHQCFLTMLQNHKFVEHRLLKQIIRLRKDRDRYRNSYNNLRKIHKILADRWYQFRKISLD
jgi:hypothetical protein